MRPIRRRARAHARSPFIYLAAITPFLLLGPEVFSQGCVPARHVSLSLGAEGNTYLNAGEWEGSLSYRYLHSERVFSGTEEQGQLHAVGGRNTIHSVDLTATYAITRRYAVGLTLPFMHDDFSFIHDDGKRHAGSSGGVGDVRLIGSAWFLDPTKHAEGNLNVGVGVKAPTGDSRATDYVYQADGSRVLAPVDIAAQPGDGGWGIVLEVQGFQRLMENLYGYASGFYLINPRETNNTLDDPIANVYQSVPDQYGGRAGLSYVVWPKQGLSLTLGGRIDGVPVHDLVGGSGGFRRAGYAIYVDPGISWVNGKNTLSVNVPVAVDRNLERTQARRGAFADFLVSASYARRF